jgi:beta-N-acetylhexosaminidase
MVRLIREAIGFDGLLMTDDLSMRALSGGFAERARRAVAAGCDLVLHCNGNREEMAEVAEGVPSLGGRTLARSEVARALRSGPELDDSSSMAAEYATLRATAHA